MNHHNYCVNKNKPFVLPPPTPPPDRLHHSSRVVNLGLAFCLKYSFCAFFFCREMESDVPSMHSEEEDLRELGEAVSLLRKRQSRFRRVADLHNSSQHDLRLQIQEKIRVSLFAHKGSLHFIDGIQVLLPLSLATLK
ncbi:hypothetical protein M8C21_002486 [Ambrosia artemisiifolia]|uniref:Uncharacterized protein n=1 Tax=Ambrosia artemisiifolia TaxID=4212 RepID=A0AAD5CTC9_AMBAR|nr:hypothetical protein M8C21_002486 [Ambrosia artemisiifolia]